MQDKKDTGALRHRILNIVGIALCVILVPILIVNCTLLIKSAINKNEVPTFGSYLPLIILTGSMEDEFPSGSVIICKTAEPEDVELHDIISFFDPESKTNAIVTHQVIGLNYDEDGRLVSFTTKGTANNTEDKLPVPVENLVGKYTGFKLPGAGSLAMFMQTTPGLIVCVVIPLIALVAFDVLRRRKFEKQHADDKDELLRELEELRRLKAQTQSGELRVESGDDTTITDTNEPQ